MFYTIGHSTRPLRELIEMLEAHGVKHLVDVRTVPRSAHNPQYNREWLPAALKPAGIAYAHVAALGGLRKARKGSINTAWKNASFQGYADYMQTPDFEHALDELLTLTRSETIAIMCAEGVPWRCHRSLIADAATARGVEVLHIMNSGETRPHSMTAFAKVENGRVTYPGAQQTLGLEA